MRDYVSDLQPEVRAAVGKDIEEFNRLFLVFWDRNETFTILREWREYSGEHDDRA